MAGLILALAVGAPATAEGHPSTGGLIITRHEVPVLGYKHFEPNGRGYGQAHPKRVFNGGDPSGLVNHLSWKHWGSAKAHGFGKTYTFKPHGGYYSHEVKMRLRASDLGVCHGKQAYRRLYYRVQTKPGGKIQPQWHPWSVRHGNICTPADKQSP